MSSVGIYYSGQGGDAARALAVQLRAEGRKAFTRDASAWRDGNVEAFDEVALIPGVTNEDALRAAYGDRVKVEGQDLVEPTPARTRKNSAR